MYAFEIDAVERDTTCRDGLARTRGQRESERGDERRGLAREAPESPSQAPLRKGGAGTAGTAGEGGSKFGPWDAASRSSSSLSSLQRLASTPAIGHAARERLRDRRLSSARR